MAKTTCLAILLVAILCLVPGCDDETDIDPNGPCDPTMDLQRCLGLKGIQRCSIESGTWEDDGECDPDHRCTARSRCEVWRTIEKAEEANTCPDILRRLKGHVAECEYVEPPGTTSCSDECDNDCAFVSCHCISETPDNCICAECDSD